LGDARRFGTKPQGAAILLRASTWNNPGKTMADSSIFAAVVNRNSGKELAGCVNALLDFLPADRIIVVDCAGTDGSVRRIPDGVFLDKANRNLGYAKGNNRALAHIRARGGKRALIINPDARIDAHAVASMVELMQDEPDVGAVFPVIRKSEKGGELEAAYGVINYRHRLVKMVGERGLEGRKTRRFFDVDFGVGCCFIVNVKAFFEVGGFDEDFFAYQDEPDLCYRLNKAGRRTVLMPQVHAIHRGVEDRPRRMMIKEYLVARNSVLFMKKHGSFFSRLKFRGFLFFGKLVYLPGAIFGNGAKSHRLMGFKDGLAARPIRPEILKDL
jgi:hypothetical protein